MGAPVHDWALLDPPLIALFAEGPPPEGALLAFARAHGIPPATINSRVNRLRAAGRIGHYVAHHARWTDTERAALERRYGRRPQAVPGRSRHAHVAQANAVGVQAADQGYSLQAVAEALGVNYQTVGRLIARRLLRGHTNGRRGHGRRWHIGEQALHSFFCTHRAVWEACPCPGRLWIEGLLYAPDLCQAHGCPPPAPKTARHTTQPRRDLPTYAGPTVRGHGRTRFREWA